MRSLIILDVEHGEDTDALEQYIADCVSESNWSDVVLKDFTVRVDIPKCFVLEK